MPEPVPARIGQLFEHRDTRLIDRRHPIIVKSIDASDLNPWFKSKEILFDYGVGGDGRHYVEISIYHRRPHQPWLRECFDLLRLNGADVPQELLRISRTLEISTVRLAHVILKHAPSASPNGTFHH
jgi:hypothetical protein